MVIADGFTLLSIGEEEEEDGVLTSIADRLWTGLLLLILDRSIYV